MSRVEQIAEQVRTFTASELRELRDVLVEYEQKIWDEKFQTEVDAGEWDAAAERALEEHRNGKTTPI